MNPKDYYEKHLPESKAQKFVLGLFPSKSAKLFESVIKPLIEEAGNELKFKSYLEPGSELNVIENILNDIQNANLIITDISGFEPNVMYELGIALVKNEKHILISDEESLKDLPFYLRNMQIHNFSKANEEKTISFIRSQVTDLIPEQEHRCFYSKDTKEEMADINKYVHQKAFSAALVIWEKLKEKDPDNVCVDELRAEILVKAKMLDEARIQYETILKSDELSKSFRSMILIKVANTFLKYHPKRKDEALSYLGQAEAYYNRNSRLYKDWAYAYHLCQNHELAYEKIEKARIINPANSEIKLLSQYYHQWKIDNSFNVRLSEFKKSKQGSESSIGIKNHEPRNSFEEFKRTTSIGALVEAKIVGIRPNGVQFEISTTSGIVKGFVHKNSIRQSNFNAIFKVGDGIMIKYSGNNAVFKSIYGSSIEKIK